MLLGGQSEAHIDPMGSGCEGPHAVIHGRVLLNGIEDLDESENWKVDDDNQDEPYL